MVRVLFLVLALALPAQGATRYFTDRAGSPVQWMEWGKGAIERAHREKRPVFLSIGFAASWDVHRMHAEAFADAENAKTLNAHFVPVLLDRIEHPQVAAAYEAIADVDGWPVNLILTPSLEPFATAGYLSTAELRQMLAQRDATGAAEMVANARAAVDRRAPMPVDATTLETVVDAVAARYTREKTLDPMTVLFLLRYAERTQHANIRALAVDTLRSIAKSGRRDQLGGGFFRCDGCYDKHLHEQALYTLAYLEAWQLTKIPELEQVVRSTVDYVLRDLRLDHKGAFEVSQYAYSLVPDPAGKPVFVNGAFYAPFTPEQIEQLGDKLFETRQKRPAPFREPYVEPVWNGLMISAAARAGAVLREPRYVDAAIQAATIVTKKHDHPALVQALLDLFDASHDVKWLDAAVAMQQRVDELTFDDSAVPERVRGIVVERDVEVPSPSALTALNLQRLAAITGNTAWRERVASIFETFGGRMRARGDEHTHLAAAYEMTFRAPRVVVVTGDVRAKETHDTLAAEHVRWEPMRFVVFLPHKGATRDRVVRSLPYLGAITSDPKVVLTYVCARGVCSVQ
ncbi:MAG TPA: DUF255 domain-containing protein [Thermoanaerobaculia bacterium]|nr:DUF255 domain-containing protein [Thermoanaerobaculia bacterium]